MKKKIRVSLTMFDMLKGLAMLLVLVRHSIVRDVGAQIEWKFLYSILMPVFFVTGGFWMKPKEWKNGIRAGCEQILKPYIVSMAVIEGTGLLHRGLTGELGDWIETFLLPGLLGMSGEGSRFGPLWFLLALFWAWSLFYLIVSVKDVRMQTGLAVLCGAAGSVWIGFMPPFQLAQGMIGSFWVYSGYRIKKERLLEKPLHAVWGMGMAALWVFTIWYGTMDLAMYRVNGGFISVLGSLCGAFLVIKVFLHLNLLENRIFDGLRLVGRYTMWILCVHGIEGALVPWRVLDRFADRNVWTGWIGWFVLRCLLIGCICVVLERIQKYKIRKRMGK